MLDLHLTSAVPRKEELRDPGTRLAVHDGYAPPISAHPNLIPPDGEAGAGGVLCAVRDGNLHLHAHTQTHTLKGVGSIVSMYTPTSCPPYYMYVHTRHALHIEKVHKY